MQKETEIIIGIGSNCQAEKHLALAQSRLREYFPAICFSSVRQTEPVGFVHNKSPFSNQLALLRTTQSVSEIRSALKDIEQDAGRKPKDKEHEIVKLDLDILRVGQETIKAEELSRVYYCEALKELH